MTRSTSLASRHRGRSRSSPTSRSSSPGPDHCRPASAGSAARSRRTAKINGVDERVDADVAIVDTGIAKVADLNVAGGYDCSTSNSSRWRDVHGHGTHVAGTSGRSTTASGVVGVAPGVRLWAVKILDDGGSGLLSWYVCGLDWISAQRDPSDPSRPADRGGQHERHEVGQRRPPTAAPATDDILHAAICRLVEDGITVVAAAANDSGNAAERVPAAYDEVITVSALADSDGKPGALGGNRCFSWGTYDNDDTFANFSNYGADVDIIAPGKCIYSTVPGGYAYMLRHLDGGAARGRRGRPREGHAGRTSRRPRSRRRSSTSARSTGRSRATRTRSTRSCSTYRVVGPRGDFSLAAMQRPDRSRPPAGSSTSRSQLDPDQHGVRADCPAVGAPAAGRPGDVRHEEPVRVRGPHGHDEGRRGRRPRSRHVPTAVVGTEHGRQREATATFQVTGSPVPPPPTRLDRRSASPATPRRRRGRSRPARRDPRPDRSVQPGSDRTRHRRRDGRLARSRPVPAQPAAVTSTGADPSRPPEQLVEVTEPAGAPAPAAIATRAHVPSRIVLRYTFVIAL